MKDVVEIEFALEALTPCSASRRADGRWALPASSLRGASRHDLGHRRSGSDETVELLWGGWGRKAAACFSDVVSTHSVQSLDMCYFSIDRTTGCPSTGNLSHWEAAPPGTKFTGTIRFDERPTGFERCIALSALLDITRIGAKRCLGYGSFDVQIVNRSRSVVFISYSWEDESHMAWVRRLARFLIDRDVDVVLDQLSPSFDVNAPQDEIHSWIRQCMRNCDKVLAILTPKYKLKAECGDGGVGFEYQHLKSESPDISNRLARYVTVLRRGEIPSSLPKYLYDSQTIDMRTDDVTAEQLDNVVRALKT